MSKKLVLLIAVLYLTWAAAYILAQDVHNHDHDLEKSTLEPTRQDEENHEMPDGHSDHEAHEDEMLIQLTPEGIELAGIKVSKVKQKSISKKIDLPGEIGFNEDRLAHISPRFAGIALSANFKVGDYVNQGDVVAKIESNESMNYYLIKAPISGWVIDRHITPGEYVSEENSIYVISDLSTVWANLAVYPKDAQHVKKGQMATIKAIGSDNVTSGRIEFVTPIMDFHTRSATARIVLPNPHNTWRPGSFIQASIADEKDDGGIVIEKNAVQYFDDKSVVFIPDGPNSYKPVDVMTGESDAEYIQILKGLSEDSEYVSTGAFELKAKIVTSNLDAHAGHGH